jgi:hypothetical protein
MTANFDTLSKKLGLNEEARDLITEAWNSKLSDAREEIAAELREEFAQKFSHDKKLVIESVDKFITEQITAEITELAEDRQKLAAERVGYKTKVAEHAKILDKFVMQQLSKELKEHREERSDFVKGIGTLENFVLTQLAEEIKEFHGDKKALREQRVEVVREARKQIAEAKKNFVSKAAELIEESVDNALKKEIKQFRDDITIARENDFGRRVFEAFVSEYASTHLNETSEIKKLQGVLKEANAEKEEVENKLVEAVKTSKSLDNKLKATQDLLNRDRTMRQLLAPLGKEKADVMKSLLESVKTDDLDKAFNKYLPAVLNETDSAHTVSRKKKVITEDVKTEKTGDRAPAQMNDDDAIVDDIENMKRLAGL